MERFYRVNDLQETMDVLKENNLNLAYVLRCNGRTKLVVGEILRLPQVKGELYRVKPFETFSHIAEKFGTTAAALREKNGMEEAVPFSEIYV